MPHDPIILGLTSACGGVGVTSISTQMAYFLVGSDKKEPGKRRVALLSLDFENSALAHYLATPPKITAELFCQNPQNLDVAKCQSWMRNTAFGFDVLSLPTSTDGNSKVNPATVLKFLDNIAEAYDALVLDIPRLWMPWTHAALGAADKLAMVTELTVPALHLTREKCEMLRNCVDMQGDFDVLVNKFEKRSVRNSLRLSDAERAFSGKVIQTVPYNADKLRDSINRGEPMGASHDSKSAKDINKFTARWMSEIQREKSFQFRAA